MGIHHLGSGDPLALFDSEGLKAAKLLLLDDMGLLQFFMIWRRPSMNWDIQSTSQNKGTKEGFVLNTAGLFPEHFWMPIGPQKRHILWVSFF